ncbi:MAG: hypothetical protein K5839_01455 [Treponemataceae bacterium]|nr:hypothetical protein [Treponemataceae bacterium]
MANIRKILYVHGLGGNKESSTCRHLREILNDSDIIAENFDLFDVEGTQKKIETLIEKHDIGILIGSSFGAFYVLARKAMPFRIVINPCMKPSFEIPKLDPSIPSETLNALQNLEKIAFTPFSECKESILTTPMRMTTFGIFGLEDELFSYKDYFKNIYIDRWEIPIAFTAASSDDGPHFFSVEAGTHKMSREQLEAPVKTAIKSIRNLHEQDEEFRLKNESMDAMDISLDQLVEPLMTLEDADSTEKRIRSKVYLQRDLLRSRRNSAIRKSLEDLD